MADKLSEAKEAGDEFQATPFEALEKDFRQVLDELVGDKSLERFRSEYEKLHQALKNSHDNEKKLIKKCRELNAEIVTNAAKVGTAMRLSQEDQNSIALLQKEIDKAWKMVDQSHEKEKRAKKTIVQLKSEITNLSTLVEQGAGLSIGQENTVAELTKEKMELARDNENLNLTIQRQTDQVEELTVSLRKSEEENSKIDAKLQLNRDKFHKTKSELDRELRRSERVQQELIGIKELNDQRKIKIEEKDEEIRRIKQDAKRLDIDVKEYQMNCERYERIADELTQKNEDLAMQVDEHMHEESQLAAEKENALSGQKQIQGELYKTIEEARILARAKERISKEKEQVERQKRDIERQREFLKSELSTIQKDLDIQTHNADTDEKLVKDLQLQVKRLGSQLQASKDKNTVQMDTVRAYQDERRTLENDMVSIKQEEQKVRKDNYSLERRHEKAVLHSSQWKSRFQEQKESLKIKEMESTELQKKITEEKNKLKMQQALYESVRGDRNLFSQQHIQAQDEIADMKRKFNIMTHQIEQLKEEIATKDQALIKQHFEVKHLNDVEKALRKQLLKKDEILQQADQLLGSQDVEIKTLRRTLVESENNQKQQKTVFDDVVDERDILGAQLIRRNDELALLYEKIKIQQSTLNKGEIQYAERVEDIQMLKLKVADLKRQLQIRNNQVSNMEALKNEVYHLQRELLQERTKVKALSEELENPMNVHRWRKLEGSDPSAFEMLQKIQTLQKRLIIKTEEVVEKDLLIQEKEKLYVELKNILARQPGPEVAEQLSAYQQTLKEKTRQMKAMAAELNMFQAQVNEYKYELERLTRELQDAKRKFLEQKRKEQLLRETQRQISQQQALQGEIGEMQGQMPMTDTPRSGPDSSRQAIQQSQIQKFQMSQTKFVGGGFALK
eukprot:187413_1